MKQSELTSKCRHENQNILANTGNSGKRNNDSMDHNRVLFIDILYFLYLFLGNK